MTRRLLSQFARTLPAQRATPASLSALTERETEVLRLLASGLSNAELAGRLYINEATVKSHVSSLLRKLGLRDRVQAVILAYDAGWSHPSNPDQPRAGDPRRPCPRMNAGKDSTEPETPDRSACKAPRPTS